MEQEKKPVIKLDLETVKKNAREWYDAGKLTAQHPDPKKALCKNNGDDGYRCAVAASYPEDFKEEGDVYKLRAKGFLDFSDKESEELIMIQAFHDNWATARRATANCEDKDCWFGYNPDRKDEYVFLTGAWKRSFLKAIDHPSVA